MKREDIIREIESMLPHGGYQVAKSILKLSEKPAGTSQKIGKRRVDRRSMSQEEARRLVVAAIQRIELADAPD